MADRLKPLFLTPAADRPRRFILHHLRTKQRMKPPSLPHIINERHPSSIFFFDAHEPSVDLEILPL
jgi:hypothetical protein